ncbi:MAG: ABC transporter substrate-binding protein, partial [Alphaproteobacteria bacterium]|nr:ABC transporter substrate-binding protein [Alphaproteobacteria bacterium]
FDAFNILIAAMKKSGPDQAKLRAAIEQTPNYVGISGVFNYSASDHGGLSKDNLVMYQAQGGAWNLLK